MACATCCGILIFQIIDNGLSRVAAWTPERARQAVVGGPGHRMGETAAARAVETARTAAASTAPRTAERGAGWTLVTATATQTLPPVSRSQGQTAEH